jgi:hypothetical protein
LAQVPDRTLGPVTPTSDLPLKANEKKITLLDIAKVDKSTEDAISSRTHSFERTNEFAGAVKRNFEAQDPDNQPAPAATDGSEHELAQQLANPVASLISVPFQSNFEFNAGSHGEGQRFLMNFQPVIPFSLNDKWNLITRNILPIIGQGDFFPGDSNTFGLGDLTSSFFFSPKRTIGGMILGVGPVFLIPTATTRAFSPGKWGAGPTFVGLKQRKGWTVGLLANHIWSFAGPKSRGDLNQTFGQPFISYTWKNGYTLGPNVEATYDWETVQWNVPFNLALTRVIKLGEQPISFGGGPRVYLSRAPGAPTWGLRFIFTLIYPKKG